jgi:cobalt-zinc-cadmium efflux system outer membrane protein
MNRKHIWLGLGLLILAGCYTRVRPEVDGLVCGSANRPVDFLPPQPARPASSSQSDPDAPSMIAPASTSSMPATSGFPPTSQSTVQFPGNSHGKSFDDLYLTSAQQPVKVVEPKKIANLMERLKVLGDIPGGEVQPIKLPDPKTDPEKFKAAVKKYFPPLPFIGPEQQPVQGPDGHPLTLADLQKIARANSPLLRQAASDVAAARGAAIQAGAYSNPTFGVESATHGPSGGPSYGFFLGQTITTMGKKKLAQAAAIMDLENAQIAYHRAETDLLAAVRGGYFQVLVAEESVRTNRALVNLTDEMYKINVEQVYGGEAAIYEPMQVGVFAGQARQALIQARNSYTLAWKQLAASMGVRGLPPTKLEGRIDMPLPKYDYDKVLGHVLTKHTDMATAVVTEQKARYNLRLAEVTAIPDVTVQTTLTQDNTLGTSNRIIAGVNASIPVPVWDRNLGAIQQSRGALMRAVEEQHRVRDALTSSVADAFRRYDENRDLLELYRLDILPKQVQAFRAAVARYYGGELGRVAFTDLIAAEQNLVTVIAPYLAALGAQWQAVTDVASWLQTEDLFQANGVFPVAPVPDLNSLLKLPCCHPCSSLPGSQVEGANDNWPPAGFMPAGPAKTPPASSLPSGTPQNLPTVLPQVPQTSAAGQERSVTPTRWNANAASEVVLPVPEESRISRFGTPQMVEPASSR